MSESCWSVSKAHAGTVRSRDVQVGQTYVVDAEGRPVGLPEVDTLRVQVRWLYSADADRPKYSHRDVDQPP